MLFQIISFVLIIRQNNFHNSSVLNSSNQFIGGIYNSFNNITSYINLKDENAKLNAENAKLKMLLQGYKINEYNDFILVNDSIKKLKFDISNAKVINAFTKGENNYITINKGKSNGIEPHMSVTNSNGIIGFTKDVSEHYATIIPVIHRKFLISVVHKKSNSIGLLKWTEENDRFSATVINLPKYVDIKVGDKILTKGGDGIFMPNEKIGVISSIYTEGGSDYNTAQIDLYVDFNALSNVYVIKNILKIEKEEIESLIEN